MSIQGIIFDMDNTLLSSRIDFTAMKRETYEYLIQHNIIHKELDLSVHTTSTLIIEAENSGNMTTDQKQQLWEIPTKLEVIGMQGAKLEPGVPQLLEQLKNTYKLTIYTNNSVEAARSALSEHQISHYFDHVVGREMVESMKPAPDGFNYILNQYDDLQAEHWISVGDSWIDGKGSILAGIKFIAYRGDIQQMNDMGVNPYAEINDIRDIIQYL